MEHIRQKFLRDMHHRICVYMHRPVNFFVAVRFKKFSHDHSCIVDQDIQLTERLMKGKCRADNILRFCDVYYFSFYIIPFFPESRQCIIQFLGIMIPDDKSFGTAFKAYFTHQSANTRCSACDQYYCTLNLSHLAFCLGNVEISQDF